MPSQTLPEIEREEVVLPSRTELAAALRFPFPVRINRHVSHAEQLSGQWMRNHFEDAVVVEKTRKARMAYMIGGFYPGAGPEELCIAADYLCWAFALDDLGDETHAGSSPAHMAVLFDRFDAAFTGAVPHEQAEAGRDATSENLVVAFRDIVERLREFATPQQVEDFRFGNHAYFGGMLWEANNRSNQWVPNKSSYIAMRPAAGAVPPFFALIEPLEGLKVERRVMNHPAVQELVRLAGGIVCWTNDVLSYEKERLLGDVHNLALIYEAHEQFEPFAALEQAVRFNNAEVECFVRGALSLPDFGAVQNAELARYVEVLGSMMRVTADWTLGSARYAGSDHLELG